ncbi:MAG: thioesterase family protein [Deltaproteobacteria bacterium]|nr:thioesterase family protein [Deltaproteobacteria bacterium]
MHVSFDESIAWTTTDDGWTTTLGSEWMQGRGAFGGIVAAAALKAMRTQVAPERLPRTFTTTFLGPVTKEPAHLSVRVLREGRAVSFLEAEILQEGTPRLRATGIFGADRDSIIAAPAPPTEVPDPDGFVKFPHVPGITPDFIQMMDVRWTEGSFPFTGVKDGLTMASMMRFKDGATPGYERILTLLDVMPAPVLQQLDGPRPASSIQWTSHFVRPDPSTAGDWCFFRYETVSAGAGYSTTIGKLYGPSGELLAWQEQLHAVFG